MWPYWVIGVWAWLRTRVVDGGRVIAVDGKILRGAKDAAGHLAHLLAALDQASGVVLGQVEVGAKTIVIGPPPSTSSDVVGTMCSP